MSPILKISEAGEIEWRDGVTRSAIMAEDLEPTLKLALLALWIATHGETK